MPRDGAARRLCRQQAPVPRGDAAVPLGVDRISKQRHAPALRRARRLGPFAVGRTRRFRRGRRISRARRGRRDLGSPRCEARSPDDGPEQNPVRRRPIGQCLSHRVTRTDRGRRKLSKSRARKLEVHLFQWVARLQSPSGRHEVERRPSRPVRISDDPARSAHGAGRLQIERLFDWRWIAYRRIAFTWHALRQHARRALSARGNHGSRTARDTCARHRTGS